MPGVITAGEYGGRHRAPVREIEKRGEPEVAGVATEPREAPPVEDASTGLTNSSRGNSS